MKKSIIIAIVLLLFAPAMLKAQVGDARNDVAVGFSGGSTFSQTSFNPTIPEDMKGGTVYGLTIRYNCEKYFTALCGIQAEINFARMGWKERIETSDDTYSRDMDYIQVPMLARMGWGHEHKGALFYLLAGPQIGVLIGEKEHRGGEFTEATLSQRPNNVTMQYGKKADKKFDYGITAGLGVEFNMGRAGHINLEGRYYLALGDIFKNSKKDDFGRSAHTAIYVKAAYLFDIIRTKH